MINYPAIRWEFGLPFLVDRSFPHSCHCHNNNSLMSIWLNIFHQTIFLFLPILLNGSAKDFSFSRALTHAW
jgi:hypothetical protein